MQKIIVALHAVIAIAITAKAQEPEILYDFMYEGLAYKIIDDNSVEISPISRTYQISAETGLPEYVYTGNNVEDFQPQQRVENVIDGKWYEVTGIGEYAFLGNDRMLSLGFGDNFQSNITYIGNHAFQNCSRLKTVKTNGYMHTIGKEAFSGCSELKLAAFGFPGNMFDQYVEISLGEDAFANCPALSSVFLNNKTTLNLPTVESAFDEKDYPNEVKIYAPDLNDYHIDNLKSRYSLLSYGSFSNETVAYSGQMPQLSPIFSSYVPDAAFSLGQINNYSNEYNVGNYSDGAYVNVTFKFGWEYNYFTINPRLNFGYSITPAPMTISVTNSDREYGEPNPEFEISVSGYVDGENESIFATQPFIINGVDGFDINLPNESTPIGDYQIEAMATLGYPANYQITYIPGTLSITPAPLKVLVNDSARPYGEKNPQFNADYEGFKNGETQDALMEIPKFFTTANIDSPVGDYPIAAEYGKAQNYTLTYYNGTLSILKADQHINWEQEFDEVTVGDEITLNASLSSGLTVEYSLSNNDNVAELDGNVIRFLREGSVDINATQPGDGNYNGFSMFKTAHVSVSSSIEDVATDNELSIRVENCQLIVNGTADSEIVRVFTLSGATVYEGISKVISLTSGIYIVQVGSLREKVVVK